MREASLCRRMRRISSVLFPANIGPGTQRPAATVSSGLEHGGGQLVQDQPVNPLAPGGLGQLHLRQGSLRSHSHERHRLSLAGEGFRSVYAPMIISIRPSAPSSSDSPEPPRSTIPCPSPSTVATRDDAAASSRSSSARHPHTRVLISSPISES